MPYDPKTGTFVADPPSVLAPAPTPKITIPVTFWQELIALLLQLFGSSVGARDQTHLLSRLREMHSEVAYGKPDPTETKRAD